LEQPDVQLHFVNALVKDHAQTEMKADGFTLHACQLRPHSRGTVELASTDPFASPLIDPNYLSTETDWQVARDQVQILRELAAQPAFDGLRKRVLMPDEALRTPAQVDAYIRETAETIYHPVSTCRMGVDEGSVVDPEMRVRGVQGLRVIDASVMPDLVSGNTNAPTIMIAEKAADMILGRPPMEPIRLSA
jgi:choline dehydrogenase